MESVTIPTTRDHAVDLAFDLDDDDDVDNATGIAATILRQQVPGIDLTAAATARLSTAVVWNLEVSQCDDGTSRVVDAKMPVSTLWDARGTWSDPGFVVAAASDIALAQRTDGVWEGTIGMAFPTVLLTDAIAGPLAVDLEGTDAASIFDTAPADGHISMTEMRESELVNVMFAADVAQGTSFAIGFTARE